MEKNKVFVAGLPWSFTNDSLRELFSKFGAVVDAAVITDKATGRSKGYGFVTFANEVDAQKAIDGMNGTELEGRKIVVNIARPREQRAV